MISKHSNQYVMSGHLIYLVSNHVISGIMYSQPNNAVGNYCLLPTYFAQRT